MIDCKTYAWVTRQFSLGRVYAAINGVYPRGIMISLLSIFSLFMLSFLYLTPIVILPSILTFLVFAYFEAINKIRYNRFAPAWVKLSLGTVGILCKWLFWIGYLFQIILRHRLSEYDGVVDNALRR